MNISEVRDLLEGASYEKEIEVLETIWNYVGDSVLNGYLGSSVETVSFDEDGRLEFDSRFETDDVVTLSTGVVLSDSVIIRQVQKHDKGYYCQLISWTKDGKNYSTIVFDNVNTLDKAYNGLKKLSGEFLDDNLNSVLEELDISFDNVMIVKIGQVAEQQSIDVSDLQEACYKSISQEVVENIA